MFASCVWETFENKLKNHALVDNIFKLLFITQLISIESNYTIDSMLVIENARQCTSLLTCTQRQSHSLPQIVSTKSSFCPTVLKVFA